MRWLAFAAITACRDAHGMECPDKGIHSEEISPPAVAGRRDVAIFWANLPDLDARTNMECRVRISETTMSLHQSKIESLPFVVAATDLRRKFLLETVPQTCPQG